MIDLQAARELKKELLEGFTSGGMKAAEALIASIEGEYGDLLPVTEEDQIRDHIQAGHTPHCAKRLTWGDNACECGKVAPPAPKTLTEWVTAIHQYALAKGWYDNDTRTFGDMCTLFHSEISEAYEEYRNGHEVTETYFKPETPMKAEGVPTELADCVIRILDYCGRVGIDLQAVMEKKHAYNLTRAYRHGGKRV